VPTSLCEGQPFDPLPYRLELETLKTELGGRLSLLITEPYLGGGGSYHPPKALLANAPAILPRPMTWCLFSTRVPVELWAHGRSIRVLKTYGLEPDLVVLGKGLGNGVPVGGGRSGRRTCLPA